MNTTEKLDLSALRSAVPALERGVGVVERKKTSAEADEMETLCSGVIQCFAVAYEMCWKSIRRWIEMHLGKSEAEFLTRKELFRKAAEAGLLADPEPWFEFHRARNETSHTYNSETARDVFSVALGFLPEARTLLATLEKRG